MSTLSDAPALRRLARRRPDRSAGRGYSEELLDQTLAGLTPPPGVIASDRRQAERTQSFEEYLRRRVTPSVVQRRRELAREHHELLAQIREQYGLE